MIKAMSVYQHHVFFCTNQRDSGRLCCAQHDALRLVEYAKKKVRAMMPRDENRIRINKAGCLEQCRLGPAIVIYPEGVWYTYRSESDIDEIVESHLMQNQWVRRLMIEPRARGVR